MSTGTPAQCPRCLLPLFAGQADGVSMLGCGRCGGLFLDNGSARKIQEAMPNGAMNLAESAAQNAVATVDTRPATPCPACSRPMGRTLIKAAGVEIDTCAQHGTWFDRGELRKVAESFSAMRTKRNVMVGAGVVGAVAVAGTVAVVASEQLQQDPHRAQRVLDGVANHAGDVIEVGADIVDVGASVGEAVGGGLIEGAGEILGATFELLGGLLSGLADL